MLSTLYTACPLFRSVSPRVKQQHTTLLWPDAVAFARSNQRPRSFILRLHANKYAAGNAGYRGGHSADTDGRPKLVGLTVVWLEWGSDSPRVSIVAKRRTCEIELYHSL